MNGLASMSQQQIESGQILAEMKRLASGPGSRATVAEEVRDDHTVTG